MTGDTLPDGIDIKIYIVLSVQVRPLLYVFKSNTSDRVVTKSAPFYSVPGISDSGTERTGRLSDASVEHSFYSSPLHSAKYYTHLEQFPSDKIF